MGSRGCLGRLGRCGLSGLIDPCAVEPPIPDRLHESAQESGLTVQPWAEERVIVITPSYAGWTCCRLCGIGTVLLVPRITILLPNSLSLGSSSCTSFFSIFFTRHCIRVFDLA